jgi:hypothetical protein
LASQADGFPVTKHRKALWPTLPVDHALVFGAFQVMQYRAGWTTSQSHSAGIGADATITAQSSRELSFALEGPDGSRMPVECALHGEGSGLRGTDRSSRTRVRTALEQELRCSLYPTKGGAWELVLSAGSGELTGTGGGRFAIAASHDLANAGRSAATVGFLFFDGGEPIGAIEVTGRGRVVLSRELPPTTRHIVAAAASAILLADLHE